MIKMYSRKACSLCQRLKQMLDNNEIEYTIVDLDETPEAVETLKRLGIKSLPVVWDDELYIGGFNTTVRYLEDK